MSMTTAKVEELHTAATPTVFSKQKPDEVMSGRSQKCSEGTHLHHMRREQSAFAQYDKPLDFILPVRSRVMSRGSPHHKSRRTSLYTAPSPRHDTQSNSAGASSPGEQQASALFAPRTLSTAFIAALRAKRYIHDRLIAT